MKNFKNLKINSMTLAVLIISLITLIIGIFAVGWLPSILIVGILNIVYFRNNILIAFHHLKKKIQEKKGKSKEPSKEIPKEDKTVMEEKPVYEYKDGEDIVVVGDDKVKKNKKKNKKKETGEPKKKKHIALRIFQWFLIFCCLCFMLLLIAAILFFLYIQKNAPKFEPTRLYSTEPSVIYYNNGEEMVTLGTEKREIITYSEIPEVYINALLATEDANFFQHNGVDLKRFLVASVKQLLGNDNAGGASTLTMQLSKNKYTSKNASGIEGIIRKFTDVYMAVFQIEPTYTKEQIIEFYVNSNQMGSAWGLEAAAKMYFGKSAKDINLAEAALLAGMYQAPTAYNPFYHPEAAENRRKQVLGLMYRHGYITQKEYEIAKKMDVSKIVKGNENTWDGADEMDDKVRSAVDTIVREVIELTGKNPRVDSMQVYTTIDKNLQNHVGKIMTGESYKWENDKVQAGIAVVDVKTGALVAVGGNRVNNQDGVINWATDDSKPEYLRQIGSTSKPLYDYGPAVEYLNWSTGTKIADEKITYSNGTPINNADGKFNGFNTIREHLKLSRNIPALKTFQKVDKSKITSFVKSLGLHPDESQGEIFEAHAIGGYNGETPLSMAAAYAAFANGGYYTEPYVVTKIVFEDGTTQTIQKETNQVMSSSTAYIITSMLQDAATYGIDAGKYKNINGVPYAGKTGTTNYTEEQKKQYNFPSNAVKDYWVVGYNTQYSIGVWYGYGSLNDGYNKLASLQHTKFFQAVAKGIFTDKTDFTMPDTVKKVTIEKDCATLLLPSEFTPANKKEEVLFVAGTEPTEKSTRFAKLSDVTNLNANVSGSTIELSWTPIATPDAFNKNVLTELNRSAFSKADALQTYVDKIYNENVSLLGTLGYNIYVETDSGLMLIDWTANSSYTLTGQYGNVNIVVKTCYSKFKDNMSSGKKVSATVTEVPVIPDPPVDPDTPDEPDPDTPTN